jgi:tripartite-type tricarboxylate transporter receptor subunit TctC
VLPEVPTIAESGLAGYEAVLWIALVAPAGTTPAIVTRLNSELNGVLGSRNAKEALDAQGVQSEPGQPSAVTERIRADTEKWRAVVAQIGTRSE